MTIASPMYLSSVPPSSWRMSVHAVRYSFMNSTSSVGESSSDMVEKDSMSLK